MSKIEDQVFKRLLAGESPADVRSSTTSSSKYAAGANRFLNHITPEIEDAKAR